MEFPTSKPGTYGQQLGIVSRMTALGWKLVETPGYPPELRTPHPVKAQQLIEELNKHAARGGGAHVISDYATVPPGEHPQYLAVTGEGNINNLLDRQLRGDETVEAYRVKRVHAKQAARPVAAVARS